jgi:membrane protein DedA with SNARE-associated domain
VSFWKRSPTESAGAWSLVPIFLVVTLESSAFLGLLFPGETVALIAGALAATQAFSLWSAFATVSSAAVLGDIAGYALGRYWGQAVLARWSFARPQYEGIAAGSNPISSCGVDVVRTFWTS